MENQMQVKVITIAHNQERFYCDNCMIESYHTVTTQAVRQNKDWKIKVVSVCVKCRTSTTASFSQD